MTSEVFRSSNDNSYETLIPISNTIKRLKLIKSIKVKIEDNIHKLLIQYFNEETNDVQNFLGNIQSGVVYNSNEHTLEGSYEDIRAACRELSAKMERKEVDCKENKRKLTKGENSKDGESDKKEDTRNIGYIRSDDDMEKIYDSRWRNTPEVKSQNEPEVQSDKDWQIKIGDNKYNNNNTNNGDNNININNYIGNTKNEMLMKTNKISQRIQKGVNDREEKPNNSSEIKKVIDTKESCVKGSVGKDVPSFDNNIPKFGKPFLKDYDEGLMKYENYASPHHPVETKTFDSQELYDEEKSLKISKTENKLSSKMSIPEKEIPRVHVNILESVVKGLIQSNNKNFPLQSMNSIGGVNADELVRMEKGLEEFQKVLEDSENCFKKILEHDGHFAAFRFHTCQLNKSNLRLNFNHLSNELTINFNPQSNESTFNFDKTRKKEFEDIFKKTPNIKIHFLEYNINKNLLMKAENEIADVFVEFKNDRECFCSGNWAKLEKKLSYKSSTFNYFNLNKNLTTLSSLKVEFVDKEMSKVDAGNVVVFFEHPIESYLERCDLKNLIIKDSNIKISENVTMMRICRNKRLYLVLKSSGQVASDGYEDLKELYRTALYQASDGIDSLAIKLIDDISIMKSTAALSEVILDYDLGMRVHDNLKKLIIVSNKRQHLNALKEALPDLK